MSAPVVFLDCETTGLRADVHEIWEVALIDRQGIERVWFLPVDLGRADPFALEVGRFHDRHPEGYNVARVGSDHVTPLDEFVDQFARLTRGVHLAGAVVSFDEERLRRLLLANQRIPAWHYHIIDVEALAAGWLAAIRRDAAELDGRREGGGHSPSAEHDKNLAIAAPPWDSEELSRALGIMPERFDRHTASGDARWARAIYEAVMDG